MDSQEKKPIHSDPFLIGKTILIAEDEEYNYYFLQKLITNRGGNVLHAITGKDVLEICKREPNIDLILMDIKLPEMDGYEATRLVKKDYPHIPVIAQTAFALSGDSEKAYAAGCDDYIAKPMLIGKLIEKMKFHLKIEDNN